MAVTTVPMIGGAMFDGVKALYRMGADVNEFINSHIREMKASEAPTVERSGRVLEKAKEGFGVGYVTPVVIITTGQLLLGNPLLAGKAVFSAATFTNPIAMTCAAVGAIYWGWGALSKKEQDDLLLRLSDGLEMGIEFIRSIIRFVVERTKDIIGEKNLDELRKFVKAARDQIKTFVNSVFESVQEQGGVVIDGAAESLDAAVSATTSVWKRVRSKLFARRKAGVGQAAP
jgi:hypothetical protein